MDPSLYTDEAIAARRAAATSAAQAAADARAARLAVATRALPHLLAGAGWVLLTVGAQSITNPNWKADSGLKDSCVKTLIKMLHDPESYRQDVGPGPEFFSETTKNIRYHWQYRARNGFGGYGEPGNAFCTVDKATRTPRVHDSLDLIEYK